MSIRNTIDYINNLQLLDKLILKISILIIIILLHIYLNKQYVQYYLKNLTYFTIKVPEGEEAKNDPLNEFTDLSGERVLNGPFSDTWGE